jgi:membrane fusion protein (multidrug efflux system)
VNVPTEALVPVLKGAQVFVVESGKAVARDVETGLRNAGRVEILSGLQAGDSVIVRGLLGLRPGSQVKPTGKR